MTGTTLGAGELEFARAFVAESGWTFASTMAANAHDYVVRGRTADPEGFDRFVALIRERGWTGRWEGRDYVYLDVDGDCFWRIGVVLNRKPAASVPRPGGAPRTTQKRGGPASVIAPRGEGSP